MDIDPKDLITLAHATMPFGKYAGRYLDTIPEAYYIWFKQKGWPKGELGIHMQSMLEIKTNGLESLVQGVRQRYAIDAEA
ncbi:MAG: DUF3820 family protein [Planctomycetes bacterium]|nr:DUF3820 family protein [Planctomycetota bacterium]